ncbi:MAG: hypothetical protein KGQ59_04225 [Bdellovibrionales bacterium]|nr:hypothetical protein [Bdellovibrionales bacterium]
MISIKTHNVLDYVFGLVIALCPYLFNFSMIDVARNLFQFVGIGILVYSLMTNYRYSMLKVLSVRANLGLDTVAGGVLLIGPWIFGYRDLLTGGQASVHVLAGLVMLGLVAFTERGRIRAEEKPEKEFPRAA